MAYRPGVVNALEEFKKSVYGENYNEEDEGHGKASDASKKRKAVAENAVKESAKYDWADLADNGRVKCNVLVFCVAIWYWILSLEWSETNWTKLRFSGTATLNWD